MAQQQRTKAPPPLKPEWRTEYQLRGGATFTEPQRAVLAAMRDFVVWWVEHPGSHGALPEHELVIRQIEDTHEENATAAGWTDEAALLTALRAMYERTMVRDGWWLKDQWVNDRGRPANPPPWRHRFHGLVEGLPD
jgi:hypothetical protein